MGAEARYYRKAEIVLVLPFILMILSKKISLMIRVEECLDLFCVSSIKCQIKSS